MQLVEQIKSAINLYSDPTINVYEVFVYILKIN